MKGYIQDQSIVLTESIPASWRNGDEVEIVIAKPRSSMAQQWDSISSEVAAQLKAEFAIEDQAFAEAAVANHPMVQEADG
jgi:hypothetical protein